MAHTLSLTPTDSNSPLATYSMLADYEWGDFWPRQRSLFLCEVVGDLSIIRPSYAIKDLDGTELHLAIYTNPGQSIRVRKGLDPDRENPVEKRWSDIPVGTTICMRSAAKHHFMDGQNGIRLEAGIDTNHTPLETAKILKCTMAELQQINDSLRKDDEKSCSNAQCVTPAGEQRVKRLSRCSICKVLYCSKECQTSHWKTDHKSKCKIIAYLRVLNSDYNAEGMYIGGMYGS